ncbi:MAG: hypothetical protein QGH11_04850 [Pirellulaceae bacterium]|nr:hypothetical protein [Pirellulaceae bacterium]
MSQRSRVLLVREECRGKLEMAAGMAVVDGDGLLKTCHGLRPLLFNGQPASLVHKLLPLVLFPAGQSLAMLALERREVFQVARRRDQHHGDTLLVCQAYHPPEVELEQGGNLVSLEVISLVGTGADRVIEYLIDLARQGSLRSALGRWAKSFIEESEKTAAGGQQCGFFEQHRAFLPIRESDFLEKLVVAGIDDQQVRIQGQQLLTDRCHPVTGITDPPRVDHFPPVRWIGQRKEFSQPAGKRGAVIVRAAMGRGSTQAEDPSRSCCPGDWKRLGIEIGQLVRGRDQPGRIILVFDEQRQRVGKTNQWILLVNKWRDAGQCQQEFQHKKKTAGHKKGEDEFLSHPDLSFIRSMRTIGYFVPRHNS